MKLGRNHPVIRRLRALRRDRSLRDREEVFVAEGIHLAAEALAAGARIDVAVVSPRLYDRPDGRGIQEGLASAGVEACEVSERLMNSLQDARSPQPVVLVLKRANPAVARVIGGREGTPLVAVACGVQDPGNLGGIWRTADAAGATGFLACGPSADLFHPRTVRATMGSVFRLPATEVPDRELVPALRAAGLALVATGPRADRTYESQDLRGPTAVLFGISRASAMACETSSWTSKTLSSFLS